MALVRSLSVVITKHLRSKLKTAATPLIVTTLRKEGSISIPISCPDFGVYKVSKFGEQKRGIHVKRVIKVVKDEQEGEGDTTKISKLLDDPVCGDPAECLIRNIIRVNFNNRVSGFCSSKSLLPDDNLTLLQLVLIDENRVIQGKEFDFDRVDPNSKFAAERSRELFKVAVPCLLHDTERWVFSRSLVLDEFNSLMDEVQKFTTLDPVGGLRDVPFNVPPGAPDHVVFDNFQSLMENAVNFYKRDPFAMPFIHCTEALMFIAGDYATDDRGLNSRQEVQELLHDLNREENIANIHAFDVVFGGVKVIPEKLAVVRDMHLTA